MFRAQARLVDRNLRRARLAPDHWYPLALSTELGRGERLAVQFSADPIVLVRSEAGSLFALEDRCAHRQVPLSLGRVEGEHLQCAYHGWRYDARGGSTRAGSSSCGARVRSFPVSEQDGLIYVFPGDAAEANRVALPSIAEARSSDYLCIPFRREIKCHYSFVHENLMDMSHQILHRRWTGNFHPRLLDWHVTDGRVAVEYAAEFEGSSALLRLLPAAILRLQSGARTETKRGTDSVTIETEYPYQSLVYRRPSLADPIVKLWNAYIPVGADEGITQPIGLLLVRKPRIAAVLWTLKPALLVIAQRIFEEDRMMMEHEQSAFEAQGTDQNREDAPFLLELRRLLLARAHAMEPHSGS